ncbi:MAG: biotin carboxylase N-terminal domain-containing protein [bacterium]
MFKKVLIANRAIPALRIAQTCRDLKIKAVIPYSEADRDSLPVLLADEAICIGPGNPADSYANISRLLSAAEVSGVDALYPGWGFLACDPEFADATLTSGKIFIGPAPDPLRLLGDRLAVRAALKRAGIPVLPGSDFAITDPATAVPICEELGLPCAVKPVSNRIPTIRIIRKEKDIEYQVRMCQAEIRAQTGSDGVCVERFIPAARTIEIHLLARDQKDIIVLNDWEVVLQNRGKKILALSPAPGINNHQRQKLSLWAAAAVSTLQITGSVTVEFLIEKDGKGWLSCLNPEPPSLHPLTEVLTGIDSIEEQLKVACGESPASLPAYHHSQFAIACQLFAEDPDADFEPSPGVVTDLRLPSGPGVRVDSHLYPGYAIPADYDLHIATVTAWAKAPRLAVNRLLRALSETTISGVATNINFILPLIGNPGFGTKEWHSDRVFGKD